MNSEKMLRGSLLSLERGSKRDFNEVIRRLADIEAKLGLLLSHADFEKDFYEMEFPTPSYSVTLMGAIEDVEPEEPQES